MDVLATNPIFQKLIELNLDPNNYAIFGSGPMYPHHLKYELNDLDIVARGDAWEVAQKLGKPHNTQLHSGLEITLDNGKIQIFNKWISSNWNIDNLIDTAEIIDGVRFVTLDKVLDSKRELNRTKDLDDIATLEHYLKN